MPSVGGQKVVTTGCLQLCATEEIQWISGKRNHGTETKRAALGNRLFVAYEFSTHYATNVQLCAREELVRTAGLQQGKVGNSSEFYYRVQFKYFRWEIIRYPIYWPC